MPSPIPYINRTSLWNAWKTIRKELKHSSHRDVVDYLEYDVDPEVWISRLLKQIEQGRYEPSAPDRFTLGKSLGFSRTMTMPAIPDLVLFRAIADHIYRKAKRREQKHVYFRRATLQKLQENVAGEARETMSSAAADYRRIEERRFLTWLKYDQYRKRLITSEIHPYFVITDVTNFFDSVLHSHVAETLRGLNVPPRMIGLLFFLLERLSMRQDYTDSHRIGLPVDEYDCSRTLAHLVLFEHDQQMVKLSGEDNYIRWMDDQNFGVVSRADGLALLAEVGKSLAQFHLTANAKKSKILTLTEARRHFHLDINALLDRADQEAKKLPKGRMVFAKLVKRIWHKAKRHEGVGEFDKILERLYRLAGLARSPIFHTRALNDLLNKPEIADRVCEYMRCTNTPLRYLNFVEAALAHPEQVYPDVSVVLIESLLRVEGIGVVNRRIRLIASALLRNTLKIKGQTECKAIAPLLILRFGDRRSIPLIFKCIEEDSGRNLRSGARSSAIVYASFGIDEYRAVRKVASALLRSPLSETIKLIERIREYDDVPDRYKSRLDLRKDSVAGRSYVDMRSILTVRLLGLTSRAKVRQWVAAWKAKMLASPISGFDKYLVNRLAP